MSIHQQILFIKVCAYSSVVPILLWGIFSKSKEYTLFIWYLLYVLIGSTIQFESMRQGNNLYTTFIFPLLNSIFLIPFLSNWKRKRVVTLVMVVLAATVGEALKGVGAFNLMASTLSNIFISIAAFQGMVRVGRTSSVKASRLPMFWVSAGALLYFSFSVIVEIARQPILEIGVEILRPILLIHAGLFMAGFMIPSAIGMTRK